MGEVIQILEQTQRLSVSEKLLIVERILRSIREETIREPQDTMGIAARSLLADYETDEELTIFTSLDSEEFYEKR